EKATVRRMVETFIGIVAEAVEAAGMQQTRHSQRHVSLVVSFRRLLAEHLAANRQPSHYASLLNISAVYLNEVVKSITGMNATSFIKNEVVLRAKRQLVHTDLSIKEIADSLGIDDHAYFSRMFTQATGVSPTLFRQKNRG
ncbi:MAG: AraC family transcriptional regulator, partial [Prevotella sp.]|nr:AraC family transcriptional regulator [Prevotella sp.]